MQSNIILQGITLDEFTQLMTGIIKEEILHAGTLTEQTPLEQKLLTTKDVAEILGLAEITIHKMKKNGKITPVYIGRSVRYPQSEVERLSKHPSQEKKLMTKEANNSKFKNK